MIANGLANIFIAIVDDDESVCRSLGRLLRAAGMQPVSYSSAEEFLADNRRPRFECLVLDIQLGGMSGIELSRRLALSTPDTPVIFLTAHDEPEMREQALRTPCRAFLKKTEPGEVVLATIREAIHLNFAARDSEGNRLDGSKTYTVTLPGPVPNEACWSFTVYDGQSRAILETGQKSAGLESLCPNVKSNADGSYTVWFGPEAPKGHEDNWVQTMPTKSYFVLLRLNGPVQPESDKTWKSGDFELVK